ncbi:MAG: glycosyltransferase family 4 protein [Pseudomonadota bacterium]
MTGMLAKSAEGSPALPLAPRGEPLPIAFYAPMKAPDHAVPSGDREIARHLFAALAAAGACPALASSLRVLDLSGDADAQARLSKAAEAEVARIISAGAGGARLWVTYHCHYKAPDLVGPAVAHALGLPYAIVEPSISPKRREGPWARFAAASEGAIMAADRLFWTTRRDRPALEAAGLGPRLVHLPPAVKAGAEPPRLGEASGQPLRLLTVAMMRGGDKAESYRRLARALRRLPGPWRLEIIGDGPVRTEIEALFAPFSGPLQGAAGLGDVAVRFLGAREPAEIRAAMEEADLLLWPGVGEGIGMVWLEAGAAGLPVVAEDGPAARDVVAGGLLAAPGDASAFADAIAEAAAARPDLSRKARVSAIDRHSSDAMSKTLGESLAALLP